MKNHTIIISSINFVNVSQLFEIAELSDEEINSFNFLIGLKLPEKEIICSLYSITYIYELIETKIARYGIFPEKIQKIMETLEILDRDNTDLLINMIG